MPKFIRLTEDTGTGKDTVFVNLDRISFARHSGNVLQIKTADGEEFHLEGPEADKALKSLRDLV